MNLPAVLLVALCAAGLRAEPTHPALLATELPARAQDLRAAGMPAAEVKAMLEGAVAAGVPMERLVPALAAVEGHLVANGAGPDLAGRVVDLLDAGIDPTALAAALQAGPADAPAPVEEPAPAAP